MTSTAESSPSTDPAEAGDGRHVIHVETPLGPVVIVEQNGRIVRLLWGRDTASYPQTEPTPLLEEAARQICA